MFGLIDRVRSIRYQLVTSNEQFKKTEWVYQGGRTRTCCGIRFPPAKDGFNEHWGLTSSVNVGEHQLCQRREFEWFCAVIPRLVVW